MTEDVLGAVVVYQALCQVLCAQISLCLPRPCVVDTVVTFLLQTRNRRLMGPSYVSAELIQQWVWFL